jgi:hypothetical protein
VEDGVSGFLANLFQLLERSGFGLLIRDAVLIYPIANVVHVLSALVFFASVAIMDLRVLGALRADAGEAVIARFRPVALGAFCALLASGVILFTPEASAIIKNPSFQIKLALIAIGALNVIWLERALKRGYPGMTARAARVPAALSLAVWLGVAAAGRYIAYI